MEHRGIEFIIRTSNKTNKKKSKFYKRLYGYKDSKKEYTYVKDGILSTIPHIKPSKSIIIVPKEKAKELRIFLEKEGAEWTEFEVILKERLG